MASNANRAGGTKRNEVEATQGTKRPRLIYVLIAGVALVLIGFALVWGLQPHG